MRKVKWGVIGTAGIAKGCTIPGMKEAENCELYAIAGRSAEKTEAYKNEFGFLKSYIGYENLLADPEVEAVYIPLSNEIHYEWVTKALNAGKHVLCEKPLAPTAQEERELIETAKKNNVLLMEAFACLHSPIQKAMKEEVKSGKIGTPLYIDSEFEYSGHDISNIRMRKETKGGAAYDLGVYNVSQAMFMLDKKPIKVQAIAEFTDQNIDIHTTMLVSFEGGCRANLVCGMDLAQDKDRRIDNFGIYGTEGSVEYKGEFNQKGELEYILTIGDVKEVKKISVPDNYRLEVEQFGRCITDGEKPFVSNEFSVELAEVMDEVLEKIGY